MGDTPRPPTKGLRPSVLPARRGQNDRVVGGLQVCRRDGARAREGTGAGVLSARGGWGRRGYGLGLLGLILVVLQDSLAEVLDKGEALVHVLF